MPSSFIHRLFLGTSATLVVIGVVVGLVIAGSPTEERLRRFDDQRVTDLQNIQSMINVFWSQTQRLPASVDAALAQTSFSGINTLDPQTHLAYEYRITGAKSYELCTTFHASYVTEQGGPRAPLAPAMRPSIYTHAAGRQCFSFEVPEPSLPPPVSPPVIK